MDKSKIDQLLARAQLLIAERDTLANSVLTELREFSIEELEKLNSLDASITAISNIVSRHTQRENEQRAPLPPNRSDPGSDYRVVAAAYYEQSRENWRWSNQLIGDYGKWMVATIAAAHIGGIYFIGGLSEISLTSKELSLWFLVGGLVSIFACALTTYYNWQENARFYAQRTNVNSLIDPTALASMRQDNSAAIQITYIVAITFGVVSVACLPIAAFFLSHAAHTAPLVPPL